MLYALSTYIAPVALFLAQAAQPAPGGGQATPPPAPGAAPPPNGAAPGAGGGGAPFSIFNSMLFPIILVIVIFYFMIMLPERRKQKARQEMIRNVKKGDQVLMAPGILGKIMRVDERDVVVQVDKDNDVRVRFLKSAIQEVLPEGAGAPADQKEALQPKKDEAR